MPTQSERSQALPIPKRGFPWLAVVLALLVHAVLVFLLAVGIDWNTERATEAEGVQVWSETDINNAVRAARQQSVRQPKPQTKVTKPQPQPQPQPQPEITAEKPPAPDIQPEPQKQQTAPDLPKHADIALERKRAEEKERERQAQERKRREEIVKAREAEKRKREEQVKAKAAEEQRKKDDKLKAILDRRAKEKAAQDARARERRKAERAAKAAENAERARAEALARMTTAGAEEVAAERSAAQSRLGGGSSSGAVGGVGSGSRGTGTGKRGISSSYAGRIKARVKRFVNFVDDRVEGNPRVEVVVNVNSRGEIQGAPRVSRSSGYPAFDRAIVNAFIDAQKLPPDVDGTYPSPLRIGWRLHD